MVMYRVNGTKEGNQVDKSFDVDISGLAEVQPVIAHIYDDGEQNRWTTTTTETSTNVESACCPLVDQVFDGLFSENQIVCSTSPVTDGVHESLLTQAALSTETDKQRLFYSTDTDKLIDTLLQTEDNVTELSATCVELGTYGASDQIDSKNNSVPEVWSGSAYDWPSWDAEGFQTGGMLPSLLSFIQQKTKEAMMGSSGAGGWQPVSLDGVQTGGTLVLADPSPLTFLQFANETVVRSENTGVAVAQGVGVEQVVSGETMLWDAFEGLEVSQFQVVGSDAADDGCPVAAHSAADDVSVNTPDVCEYSETKQLADFNFNYADDADRPDLAAKTDKEPSNSDDEYVLTNDNVEQSDPDDEAYEILDEIETENTT